MTLNISLDIVKQVSHSKILTWKPLKPEIETSVPKIKKTETNLVFKQKFAFARSFQR